MCFIIIAQGAEGGVRRNEDHVEVNKAKKKRGARSLALLTPCSTRVGPRPSWKTMSRRLKRM